MGQLVRTIATLIVPLVAVASAPPPLADETPFTRLLGKDIRARVIGKTVTDGAHWSDTFDKSGALVSWSQGRKSAGTWEIRGDELCIAEAAGADATCYQVWVARDEISLRIDGVESGFTGYLRNP
ncbi:MAG TPA: hypothetical protein VJN67_01320 [Stellaceae bacterium]|nr:hypothetical protein [Stellaceae bacterium]